MFFAAGTFLIDNQQNITYSIINKYIIKVVKDIRLIITFTLHFSDLWLLQKTAMLSKHFLLLICNSDLLKLNFKQNIKMQDINL